MVNVTRLIYYDGTANLGLEVPSTNFLLDGTVLSTKFLLDGTVPSTKFLLDGIVTATKHYLIIKDLINKT